MNNKIILSSIVIGVVGALVIGGTTAYFTDVETSTANTISTGTIDIAVEGENPWAAEGTVTIKDIKPSQHEYAEYVIHNVGSNPANIFKAFKNIVNNETVVVSEPQCVALGGEWKKGETDETPACSCIEGTESVLLSKKIINDLSVWVYKTDPSSGEVTPVWWQVIYTDEMGKTLSNLQNKNVLLGMLPSGWFMKVQQSYHMNKNAGNEYQNAGMTFDIQLTAEQLRGTVTLENKLFPAEEYDAYSKEQPTIIHDDGIDATVEYTVKDKTFNYELKVNNFIAGGNYTLIAWPENDAGFDFSDSVNAIVLANVTLDSNGSGTVEGILDLNQDLINAKLWLISGTYSNLGQTVGTFPWDESGLFETALMDYYDSLK